MDQVSDDIFCKIIRGELGHSEDKTVARDENFLVIHDINPQAPVHVLIIPVRHYASLSDFKEADVGILGKALIMADKVANKLGLEKGYRLIINKGEDGGQAVPHLHIHLLGGKVLGPKLVK